MPVAQRKASPARASSASWVPGTLVVDEDNEKLSVEFVKQLRETGPLPERERWLPTRWLMMAVWEAVHCEGAAMSSLRKGFRSAQDNDALVVEIYRKMSCDNASAADEAPQQLRRAPLRILPCLPPHIILLFSTIAGVRHW